MYSNAPEYAENAQTSVFHSWKAHKLNVLIIYLAFCVTILHIQIADFIISFLAQGVIRLE